MKCANLDPLGGSFSFGEGGSSLAQAARTEIRSADAGTFSVDAQITTRSAGKSARKRTVRTRCCVNVCLDGGRRCLGAMDGKMFREGGGGRGGERLRLLLVLRGVGVHRGRRGIRRRRGWHSRDGRGRDGTPHRAAAPLLSNWRERDRSICPRPVTGVLPPLAVGTSSPRLSIAPSIVRHTTRARPPSGLPLATFISHLRAH